MRFLLENFRLSDDVGRPVASEDAEMRTSDTVEGKDLEEAVSEYLKRDGYEMVGNPTSFSGSRALLTIRKGRAVFAVHVQPIDLEDGNPGPC